MSNYNEWAAAIDKAFDEKVVQAFVEKQRTIAIQAFKEIITDSRTVGFSYGSPVWTHRFAGSHRIAIGQIDKTILPPHPEAKHLQWPDEPEHPYPSPALSEASIKLSGLKFGENVYISNSLPYAAGLEKGRSLKAPEGVYNITAERMDAKYNGTKL